MIILYKKNARETNIGFILSFPFSPSLSNPDCEKTLNIQIGRYLMNLGTVNNMIINNKLSRHCRRSTV